MSSSCCRSYCLSLVQYTEVAIIHFVAKKLTSAHAHVDTVDNGALVRDIFVAMPGLHCEIEGVKCSGRGSCAPGNYGCICFTKQFVGEYCELENKNYKAAGVMIKVGATSVISVIICSLWLV